MPRFPAWQGEGGIGSPMGAIAEEAARKQAAADFMVLGEGPPFAELINGNIVMAPSPFRSHQRVIQRNYQLLQNHLDHNPAGEAYLAPFDVHFSESDVLCPDSPVRWRISSGREAQNLTASTPIFRDMPRRQPRLKADSQGR